LGQRQILKEPLMKASFKLFRIAGIDIGIHYSWLFIFIFFTWTLAAGYFPANYSTWSTGAYWLIGAITSLCLFASVLLHEIAHSLIARAKGIPVNSITLFILGGVSNLEEEPKEAGTEFIMALSGPATSLVLALIFWGITRALVSVSASNPGVAILAFLWYINLALGIFNLLPGFPMDGGRVLRSIIWGSTKNLVKATNIAGIIGQVFGWLVIAYGVYYVIAGAFINGLWAVFLGWFLMSAAASTRRETTLRERLSQVKVRELMNLNAPTISPETTVKEMVNGIFQRQHDRAVPVCQGNQLLGIATIADIKKVPQERWAVTPVKEIMSGRNIQTVSPDDDLNTAMKLIAKNDINQVIIKDKDQCAGLLTRADIIRYIQTSQELRLRPPGGNNRPV
jgi:Zn-dependent protease/CBS domain-containing protein